MVAAVQGYHDHVHTSIFPLVGETAGRVLDVGGGVGATSAALKAAGRADELGRPAADRARRMRSLRPLFSRPNCSVQPGITGLWQISGRNDVSYRRRVAYDVMYSRRRSVLMDFKILAMTLPCVAMQKGAY